MTPRYNARPQERREHERPWVSHDEDVPDLYTEQETRIEGDALLDSVRWEPLVPDNGIYYHPPARPGVVVGPYPDVNEAAAERVAADKAEGDRYRRLSSTLHRPRGA